MVAVLGATGLVGNCLLRELLNDPWFQTVRALVRRPLNITHPKLEKKLVDFNDKESIRLALEECDVIFCAIGTTQQKVKGDQAAYRQVDFDIPVDAAVAGKPGGCNTYVLVSAAGANSASRNFYLRLKGEVEEAIHRTGIESIYVLRPSILLGNRQEKRTGEKIGQAVMTTFRFLLPSKFKPIQAFDVAKAMVAAAKEARPGFHIYEYKQMMGR